MLRWLNDIVISIKIDFALRIILNINFIISLRNKKLYKIHTHTKSEWVYYVYNTYIILR